MFLGVPFASRPKELCRCHWRSLKVLSQVFVHRFQDQLGLGGKGTATRSTRQWICSFIFLDCCERLPVGHVWYVRHIDETFRNKLDRWVTATHCKSLQVIASSSLSGCVSCVVQTFHTRQQVLWPRILSPSAHLGFLKTQNLKAQDAQAIKLQFATEQTREKKTRMWICGYVGIYEVPPCWQQIDFNKRNCTFFPLVWARWLKLHRDNLECRRPIYIQTLEWMGCHHCRRMHRWAQQLVTESG